VPWVNTRAGLVDDVVAQAEEAHVRMRLDFGAQLREGPGLQAVVIPQQDDVFARGSLHEGVSVVGPAEVPGLLEIPHAARLDRAGQDGPDGGLLGRRVVGDDDLDIGPGIIQQRLHRLADVFGTVIRRDEQGKKHRHRVEYLAAVIRDDYPSTGSQRPESGANLFTILAGLPTTME
jgi:hypothetical protein